MKLYRVPWHVSALAVGGDRAIKIIEAKAKAEKELKEHTGTLEGITWVELEDKFGNGPRGYCQIIR